MDTSEALHVLRSGNLTSTRAARVCSVDPVATVDPHHTRALHTHLRIPHDVGILSVCAARGGIVLSLRDNTSLTRALGVMYFRARTGSEASLLMMHPEMLLAPTSWVG